MLCDILLIPHTGRPTKSLLDKKNAVVERKTYKYIKQAVECETNARHSVTP